MNDFLVALNLLTILPIPSRETNISARALAFYPLVGLILGAILALFDWLLRLLLPSFVTAALVVGLWAALTGALHLDGFADACDGLFASTTRERRLEILRDVHMGAFGAAGLILLLITKVAAVASAPAIAAILIAPILGRWASVYAAAYPLARREGMAVRFGGGVTRREISIATFFTALVALMLGVYGVIALMGSFVVATLIARFALARLGGLTGDIYGMICESVEVAALVIGCIGVGG